MIHSQSQNEIKFYPSDFTIRNVTIKIDGKNNCVLFHENLVTSAPLTIEIIGSGNLVEIGEYNRFLGGLHVFMWRGIPAKYQL